MSFTVKDLAEYAGIDIKELIQDLTNRAPDINWKQTTQVPDTLVEAYTAHVDEYKAASEPIGALASTDGGSASITQLQLNVEASQYALSEAMSQVAMKDIITTAIADSLEEIQAYEVTKNQVWNGYYTAKKTAAEQRAQELNKRLQAQGINRQGKISEQVRQAEAIKKEAQQGIKDAQSFLQRTLDSFCA